MYISISEYDTGLLKQPSALTIKLLFRAASVWSPGRWKWALTDRRVSGWELTNFSYNAENGRLSWQMKALKKWVFDKTVPTLWFRVETHNIFPQHQSHIEEYEEQVSTFPFHEAKSWWALIWRGHNKRLLWCWTLSVLAVQPEATVRGVLRRGV